MNYVENNTITPIGHIQMTMFKGEYKNGKINGEILNQYEEHNLIVNMASKFMAGRMVPECTQITADPTMNEQGVITSTTSSIPYNENNNYPLKYGFQYLALGNGYLPERTDDTSRAEYLYSADTQVTEDEQRNYTTLIHETLRKPIINWAFVNEDYSISTEETNIIRLSTLIEYNDFDIDEDNYWIVEMGLFGGNATDIKDSGYMFNYKVFKAWNMLKESKLLINWYIKF